MSGAATFNHLEVVSQIVLLAGCVGARRVFLLATGSRCIVLLLLLLLLLLDWRSLLVWFFHLHRKRGAGSKRRLRIKVGARLVTERFFLFLCGSRIARLSQNLPSA